MRLHFIDFGLLLGVKNWSFYFELLTVEYKAIRFRIIEIFFDKLTYSNGVFVSKYIYIFNIPLLITEKKVSDEIKKNILFDKYITLSNYLDKKYGKKGTVKRDEFEKNAREWKEV